MHDRQEQAKEEERKYGMEDSNLPGASSQPPAASPVGAGLLPATALSGECPLRAVPLCMLSIGKALVSCCP